MEKIFSDIIESIKRFLYTVFNYFQGPKGFSVTLFQSENENREGRKYFTLLYSATVLFLIGNSLNKFDFSLQLNFFQTFYDKAVDDYFNPDSHNYLLRKLLFYTLFLEVSALLLGKNKTERNFVSLFNFTLAGWMMILFCVVLLVLSFCKYLYNLIKPGHVLETLAGLAVIILTFGFTLHQYAMAYRACREGFKDGKISKRTYNLTIVFSFLVPIFFVLSMKNAFMDEEPKTVDSIYFFQGNEHFYVSIDSLAIDSFHVRTQLVMENHHDSNYIIAQSGKDFLVKWQNFDDFTGKAVTEYTDSLFFSTSDKLIAIEKNKPALINLETTVDTILLSKLLLLREDSQDSIHFSLKTLNVGTVSITTPTIDFDYLKGRVTVVSFPKNSTF